MHTPRENDSLLDRSFRVLDLVARNPRPTGFTDLLNKTGINRATLAKILRILCAHGMLVKSDDGYRIGWKPAEYAAAGPALATFTERYRPALRLASERFGASAMLLKVTDGYSVCLDKVVNEHAPALRPVGSVMEESLAKPWTQARASRAGARGLEELANAIRVAIREMRPAAPVPPLRAVRQLLADTGTDAGDDGGWVVPNVRRIALKTPDGPDPTSDGFLVAGYFLGAPIEPAALFAAWRSCFKTVPGAIAGTGESGERP